MQLVSVSAGRDAEQDVRLAELAGAAHGAGARDAVAARGAHLHSQRNAGSHR